VNAVVVADEDALLLRGELLHCCCWLPLHGDSLTA
jgi:hypothetical protein